MKKSKAGYNFQVSNNHDYCCVPLCANTARLNGYISFHVFPKDKDQRAKWLAKVRRDNFVVTRDTKVCGRHFEADAFSNTATGVKRLKRGAVPTLYAWNDYSIPVPRPGVWERCERPTAADVESSDSGEDDQMMAAGVDHDYCAPPDPAALDTAAAENQALKEEIERLKNQLAEVQISATFNLRRFAGSDEDIRFYTRLVS